VDVSINEARAHVPPPKIDLLRSVVEQPDANDGIPRDGDVSFDDLTGEDIDHTPIAKQKISRFIATGDGEKAIQLHRKYLLAAGQLVVTLVNAIGDGVAAREYSTSDITTQCNGRINGQDTRLLWGRAHY
jgi:hypothetical protein